MMFIVCGCSHSLVRLSSLHCAIVLALNMYLHICLMGISIVWDSHLGVTKTDADIPAARVICVMYGRILLGKPILASWSAVSLYLSPVCPFIFSHVSWSCCDFAISMICCKRVAFSYFLGLQCAGIIFALLIASIAAWLSVIIFVLHLGGSIDIAVRIAMISALVDEG